MRLRQTLLFLASLLFIVPVVAAPQDAPAVKAEAQPEGKDAKAPAGKAPAVKAKNGLTQHFIPALKKNITTVNRELLRFKGAAKDRVPKLVIKPGVAVPVVPAAGYDWTLGNTIQFPILGNDQYGDCMKPGTLILLSDGTSKPIEAIVPGDMVVTAEGNNHPVTAINVRQHSGSMMRLVLWGHSHLECTPKHPILTQRGYVAIKDIVPGDWVAMPAYSPGRLTSLTAADYLDRGEMYGVVSESRRGYAASVAAQKNLMDDAVATFPKTIRLTRDFGRLIGLYAAEGSTNQNLVAWSYDAAEESTLVAETQRLIASELNLDSSISRPKPSVIQVRVSSKLLRIFFDTLIAKGALNKTLHADLMGGPVEFLDGVLTGWLDGDGGTRGNTATGTTSSRHLAQDMYAIAQTLRQCPTITWRYPTENGIAKEISWNVTVREDTTSSTYGRRIDEQGKLWRQVRSTESRPYRGPVHNFSVAVDQSYVAEGVGVHNCYYACICHGSQTFWGMNGKPITFSETAVVNRYLQIAGGDNGLGDTQALPEWQGGIVGPSGPYKIVDYMVVDFSNDAAVQLAQYCFGGTVLTVSLLDTWLSNPQPGDTWDAGGTPNPADGHAIYLNGWNGKTYTLQTWAFNPPIQLTPAGLKAADPEVVTVFSMDWFNAQGYAPNGLHYTVLAPLWVQLGGNQLPPSPFPPPTGSSLTISVKAVSGIPGNTVTFTPTIGGGTAPYTQTWQYGDGTTGTTPSHVYAAAGSFTASLTVTDASAPPLTGTIAASVIIGSTPPPPPPPPPPPGPGPAAAGAIVVAVNAGAVTITPGAPGAPSTVDVPTGTILTIAGLPPSSMTLLKAELTAAGVSPTIITDILQLFTDIKAKAGLAVILSDIGKVITDLGPALAPADKGPAPAPRPKGTGGLIRPLDRDVFVARIETLNHWRESL